MKVVFLDRDGTVIKDPADERVDKIEKIELFPDSIEALRYLASNDFSVIFVTNQAGIAEGKLTEKDFWKIHSVVIDKLSASGINVLETYVNGEAPGPKATAWRKPGPEMLLQAANDFNLDVHNIYMVGDSQSDIEAGINAGCKGSVLVETATNKKVVSPDAVYSAPNLMSAVEFVVENS